MVDWQRYVAILARRWIIIAVIVLAVVLVAGVQFARSARSAGYQSCTTLFIADASSPSMISAPPTSLQGTGALLAGETAANFFGDDILDVAQSRSVAAYVSHSIAPLQLPHSAYSDINGAIGGSRLDRTDSICVTNPSSNTAQAAANAVDRAMTIDRKQFLGSQLAHRTYVQVVSPPDVGPAPVSRNLLSLALRVVLGILLALAVAFLWDTFDPRVRDQHDVETVLGAPILASSRGAGG